MIHSVLMQLIKENVSYEDTADKSTNCDTIHTAFSRQNHHVKYLNYNPILLASSRHEPNQNVIKITSSFAVIYQNLNIGKSILLLQPFIQQT